MYDQGFESLLEYRHDMRHCRKLLRQGSHSFFAASLLLPAHFRGPITALYAFCRVADDLIDAGGPTDGALAELHLRLDGIYAGRPANDPVDRAFADVVARFGIPRELPDALLEGFDWDTNGRRYRTLSDVYAYSARVAGTVGLMMALLMGARQPLVLSRACDLGIAMQLTNIARDVGEDARAGRIYLPLTLLESEGIDAGRWLAAPTALPGVRRVVAGLLAAAERLYARANWGIAQLPLRCRPAIFAASSIYADIGRVIAGNDHDSVSVRAVVGTRRKLLLLRRALGETATSREPEVSPSLSEARFLLDAVGTP